METSQSPKIELRAVGILGDRWRSRAPSAASGERPGRRGFRPPPDSSDEDSSDGEQGGRRDDPTDATAAMNPQKARRRAVAAELVGVVSFDEQMDLERARLELWEHSRNEHRERMEVMTRTFADGHAMVEDHLAHAQKQSLEHLKRQFSVSSSSRGDPTISDHLDQMLKELSIRQNTHEKARLEKLKRLVEAEADRERLFKEAENRRKVKQDALIQRRQLEDQKLKQQKEDCEREVAKEKELEIARQLKVAQEQNTAPDPKKVIEAERRGCHQSEEFQRIDALASVFAKDHARKRDRMKLKKSINVCTNQISATQNQVLIKVNDFVDIIINSKALGEHGNAFAMIYIAERLVSEGEGQVTDHLESCFPVAAVASALMACNPDMTPVLVGQFHKTSSYTVPIHVPRPQNSTLEEYKILAGFKIGEAQENFYQRTSGIVSLYAAIMQTQIPASAGLGQNPHGMRKAWEWLAKMCNAKTKRITASILIAFLEVAGFEMHLQYKNQFSKVLNLINSSIIPQLPKDAPPGATARLQLFIMDYFENSQRLAEPQGKSMPPNDLVSL